MLTENQKQFVSLVEEKFGADYVITRKEILSLIENTEFKFPQWIQNYRISHGKFKMPSYNDSVENVVPMKKIVHKDNTSMIPPKDENFEKFGFYNDLKNIIKSKMFFPIFISGHSGLGKTHMVLQVCAELKRECIRVNFSTETDQSDLIGSPTLVDGNISFSEGPVVTCLRNGWVLLLDEIDRCSASNVLILNSVLEGNGIFIPKTGEYVRASEGFQVIVTANSKGYGDESGKYLSQILDSAFLERFPITFEQDFPSEKTEIKILSHYLEDSDFVEKLVKWARVIRKTFDAGGIDELISIRRLIHIAQSYNIFNDKMKAITLCVSRYDSQVKDAFLDLYSKIDAGVNLDENGEFVETEIPYVEDEYGISF